MHHVKNDDEERLFLRKSLIALFAQFSLTAPSEKWLGLSAYYNEIIDSGLWNVQNVKGRPLIEDGFYALRYLSLGV